MIRPGAGTLAPADRGVLDTARAALEAVDRDPDSGRALAEAAARAAARVGSADAASIAERAWGHALMHCGEVEDAVRHLRRALRWGERAGSAELTAEARMKLAYAVLQRGRPGEALREIDAALPDLRGSSAGRGRAQRAIVLLVAERPDEALAEFAAALTVLRRHDDLLGVQRLLINRALVLTGRFAFEAAVRDLAEAETLAVRLDRTLTLGLIANNRGTVETLRGDVPAALAHLDRAEQVISAHGAQLGTLHQDRAELLLATGLVTESKAAAARATDAYRRERRTLRLPEMQLLVAEADLLGGDATAARDAGRRAAARFREQRRPEWAAMARLTEMRARLAAGDRGAVSAPAVDRMIDVLLRAGRTRAALECAVVAARLAPSDRTGDPHDRWLARAVALGRGPAALRARGRYARALAAERSGDPAAALRAARAGLRILDDHAAAMGATDLRAHAAAHRADLVDLGLRVAARRGRPSTLLEWAEHGRATHLRAQPVRPPQDPTLRRLLAELRAAARSGDGDAPGPDGPGSRQAELERRIRDRARHLRGTAGASDRPVAPGPLRASLAAAGRSVLVEFLVLDGVLHALSLRDTGRVRVDPLGPLAPVTDLVGRLAFALRRLGADRGDRPDASDAAARLRDAAASRLDTLLLGPLAARIADRPLVVVPTGPLHDLPWSLLPSCRARPVALAPSATLWHRASGVPGPDGPVAVVAGPDLAAAPAEAAAVARIHGVPALAGADATVDAVLGELDRAGTVHLAAHGHLNAENPLFSHVTLADGPLVLYDVERSSRVPHTVVLAACDGGRPVVRAGDEVLGLAVSFLARGAAQVVAPVVPVPDASTVPVMVAFHERLAGGAGPAEALAGAQADTAGRDPRTAAAAAGFVCVGSGSAAVRP